MLGRKPTRDSLDIVARVLLMPVVLVQAVFVRRRYVELPEPTGARSGSVGNGPALRLLIIGDSSAAGVGVETQADALLGQLTALLSDRMTIYFELVAQTGAKTADVLGWLDGMAKAEYDVVVTALGVNDVTKGVSLRRWLGQQVALFNGLVARFSARRIIVSGLPPVGQFPLLPHPLRWVLGRQAIRFDRHLRGVVAKRAVCTAVAFDLRLDETNMSPDGFHPGPVVYAVWAEKIAQIILSDPDLLDARPDAS